MSWTSGGTNNLKKLLVMAAVHVLYRLSIEFQLSSLMLFGAPQDLLANRAENKHL